MNRKELLSEIIGYGIDTGVQHGYHYYHVKLIVEGYGVSVFSFRWQANTHDCERWYGGTLELNGDRLELISAVAKLMHGVFSSSLWETSPAEVVSALEGIGIAETRHHPKLLRWYTEKDWPTKSVYRLMVDGSYQTPLFANSESEAIAEGIKYVADRTHLSSLVDWLKNPIVEHHCDPLPWEQEKEYTLSA